MSTHAHTKKSVPKLKMPVYMKRSHLVLKLRQKSHNAVGRESFSQLYCLHSPTQVSGTAFIWAD